MSDEEGGINLPMILAIVGWRYFDDYNLFKAFVNNWTGQYGKPDLIISGGCKGADKMAERYAKANGIDMRIYPPKANPFLSLGARFLLRDKEIAEACTHMIAFPNYKLGKGTQHTIRFANKAKKHVTVHEIK